MKRFVFIVKTEKNILYTLAKVQYLSARGVLLKRCGEHPCECYFKRVSKKNIFFEEHLWGTASDVFTRLETLYIGLSKSFL